MTAPLAVDLYSEGKNTLVAQMYEYPRDFEHPCCELCGSLTMERRILIPQAKGTLMSLVECTRCGLRFFSPRPKWSILAPLVADEREQAQHLFDWGSFTPVDDPVVQKANIRSYYQKMFCDCTIALGKHVETSSDTHARASVPAYMFPDQAAIDAGYRIPNSMFEVGGNVGWFSLMAKDCGVPVIDGCDLNPHAVKLAREQHGLTGYEAGDFANYEPTRRYEMIVANDYLEHTYTPRADLENMASMIVPGGVFLFKTFLDERDTRHEMLAPPSHSLHWTEPVLREAIERTGMKIVNWRLDYPAVDPYFVIGIARKP